ncbi:hypothetical protein D5S18_12535 [Nocardia panacis]|uniref:Uncharacterized protein n=1 Tax=Nocardia panacis TaxID=2340916 RepID=A0A3A4L3W5_9NOCA|nr:hypothetical protein [Nocardia panacis]RJO77013.1 hypothetical protein D5S18_12535 [Nocardia panacis]
MTSARLHLSAGTRNRLLLATGIAVAGGVAWLVRSRRPQPPVPAPAPPRIGYSRNGSSPAPAAV